MNGRFALNRYCFLVSGAKRGAIYDLESGNIFSINEDAHNLLKLCESGIPLQEITRELNFSQNKTDFISYLNKLKESNLGIFLRDNEQIKKMDIGRPEHKIDFMWLEVTKKCNLQCIHCYNDKLNNNSYLELSVSGNKNRMRVIKNAYDLGCKKIQFIGGEPFLLNGLLDLVEFTKNTGYDFVEIFTNGTLVKEKHIDFLAKHNVSMAVSFYGPNRHIHNQVTMNNTSFHRTVNNLKKMKMAGLKIRIGLIAMAINQDYIKRTTDFLKEELGLDNVKYDIVRPVGKGAKKDLAPIKLIETHRLKEQKFPKCSLEMFRTMKYGHNCFSSKICITTDGEVIPCIMERDIVFGNAFKNDLGLILDFEKNKKIRGLSKDFIEVCNDCEYRYGCFDCRPKAKKCLEEKSFYAKPQECSYDPYLGQWINK